MIEYALNREIPPALQQYFSKSHTQLIQESTSNDATIPSRGTLFFLQPQASNARQDQEHELEIDNEAPGLFFLLDPKLYEVEKLDQVKPLGRPSGPLNKKKPTRKNKKSNSLCNETFRGLSMLINNSTNALTLFLILLIIKPKRLLVKNRKLKVHNLELKILWVSKIPTFFFFLQYLIEA